MNPYFIDEPAAISLSGGLTSGYMIIKILEAHNGILPEYHKILFCNTGKEHDKTLDFIYRLECELNLEIIWIELSEMTRTEDGKYNKKYKITDYKNASRNGEPFKILLDAMPAIPNIINMACTAYLKTRLMRMYCDDIGMDRGCITAVGLRADEPRRVVNLHDKKVEGFTGYCPLYLDGVTKGKVSALWASMPFRLGLPNNDGVTPLGNCVLCYKKALGKRLSIIKASPDLADWWIKAEKDKGQYFRPDQPSYQQLKHIALNQFDMFKDIDDESIPCFCGD